MGSRIDLQLEKLLKIYPNISLMTFGDCPGSRDDAALHRCGVLLIKHNINTHLSENSIVESGATDLYLVGKKRTKEDGSKIGVHAWSEGNTSAADFAADHREQQPYIDFYIACGFSAQDAKSFYFFTINTATPKDIHYMTDQEVIDYGITN